MLVESKSRCDQRTALMETFQMESCVRGYHIYKELWEATIGENLECQRERDNPSDTYAVAVKKGGTVVGHLPRRLSRLCALFIRRGGAITCIPTGRRRYSSDLPQGGLERIVSIRIVRPTFRTAATGFFNFSVHFSNNVRRN